jgi:hypothetical protein
MKYAESLEIIEFLIENGAELYSHFDICTSLSDAFYDMRKEVINALVAVGVKLENSVKCMLNRAICSGYRTIEHLNFAFVNGISFTEYGVYVLSIAAATPMHNATKYLTKEAFKETLRAMLSKVEKTKKSEFFFTKK